MEQTNSKKNKKQNTGFKLNTITAKNDKQKQFFQIYNKFQVISLVGSAGVGKSFLALYQALKSVESEDFKNVLIIRSSVPTRNIGFLPGNKKEKMEDYESPYVSLCTELYGRGDAYSVLKQKKLIEFESTSYLRGMTFNDTVIILDEAQNCSRGELYTLLTRLGENSKLIICGDTKQDDLTSERYREESGLTWALSKLRLIDAYHTTITFTPNEIVRSGFVKEFIKITEL